MLSDLEDRVASHCHLQLRFLVAFGPRTAGFLKHSGHTITWRFVQNCRTNGSAATGWWLVTLIQGQNLVILARDKHEVFTGMKCPCSDWDLITCLAENGEIPLFLWRGLCYWFCKHVDEFVKVAAFPTKLGSMLSTNYSASTFVYTVNLGMSIIDVPNWRSQGFAFLTLSVQMQCDIDLIHEDADI